MEGKKETRGKLKKQGREEREEETPMKYIVDHGLERDATYLTTVALDCTALTHRSTRTTDRQLTAAVV